tara:strand:- start:5293 stop:6294 length:1002 start_codon:yes stop_codon:yes gene_type:complete
MGIGTDKKKGYSKKRLPKNQRDQDTVYQKMKGKQPVKMVPTNSGLFHTVVPMKNLSFKMANDESVIQHGGSYIVLGTDRPASKASGAGAEGFQGTSTIDLVVGRGAGASKGAGPQEGAQLDPMMSADAARVYISQLTDIDKNFGLAGGKYGYSKKRSGIGIKADDVRIIGRTSIKIVTGRSSGFTGIGADGEPNSLGGKQLPAPAIELIAGDHTEPRIVYGGIANLFKEVNTLQRAVLGDNLVDALKELHDAVGEIWSALYNLTLIQAGYNALNSVDQWRPWIAAAGPPTTVTVLDFVLNSLWHTRANMLFWELNHLEPFGYLYINSSNVTLS